MSKLKLGLIGAGSMGKNHAKIASFLSGVALSGIADVDPARAQSLALQFSAQSFTDYRQLLSACEAVIVATPAQTHYQIAKDCLAAGKPLLLEKPFTGSFSLATELVNLAKQKSLPFAIGMIERFNPAWQKLLKLVKGEKIIGLDIKRFSPLPERIADADVVLDMMIHDLDLFPLIMKEPVVEIKVKGEKIRTKKLDRVVATFTHQFGSISRIEANRVFSDRTRKISVTTEKHLLEADLLKKKVYVRDFSSPTPSTIPIKETDQLSEELTNFVAALKGKADLLAPAESVLAALKFSEEIVGLC